MVKKQVPIGYSNFEEVITNDLYYVDKTNIIKELLEKKKKIVLFPRPRRFGKSLMISMLDYFFNIEHKEEGRHLFDGLNISQTEYMRELSSKPVIKLNFKDLKQETFGGVFNSFKSMIRSICNQKDYLYETLSSSDKEVYDSFLYETASLEKYQESVKLMSEWLYRYYNEKAIILIDEYDVPIQQGYLQDYYKDVVSLIRGVFSNALKDNDNVYMTIMTGVLRVSKESLFSDLNNVDIYGVVDGTYNEYFGFTVDETRELLNYYDMDLTEEVLEMYDGYNFNGTSICNPWSILNYANRKRLENYWINTSGNELIMDILKRIPENAKIIIERLLQDDEVAFRYDDKITFLDLNKVQNTNVLINFLLISGYLTMSKNCTLNNFKAVIPNNEVREMFYRILEGFLLDNYIDVDTLNNLQGAFINNDKEIIEKILNQNLLSLSFYDTKENFYHGYVLGMFNTFFNSKYIIKSNREAGSGRFDIMLESEDRKLGIIIEFKITDGDMEKSASEALNQMKEKEYYKELVLDKVSQIYEYAIVFKGKECIVR